MDRWPEDLPFAASQSLGLNAKETESIREVIQYVDIFSHRVRSEALRSSFVEDDEFSEASHVDHTPGAPHQNCEADNVQGHEWVRLMWIHTYGFHFYDVPNCMNI